MLTTGMLSVTFRQLTCEQIVRLVKEAELKAIEWGGDKHVQHGHYDEAQRVRRLTEDEGLAVASYGSYYRAGVTDGSSPAFEVVLQTAAELGAPAIRIWAGNKGSAVTTLDERAMITADIARAGELAGARGIAIHLEYHAKTLTDTAESTALLLAETGHANVRTNWQPPIPLSANERLETLQAALPHLADLHVFHWVPGQHLALAEGAGEWLNYLKLARSDGRRRYAMLEFVKDSDPGRFLADAALLNRLVAESAKDE